MASRQQVLAGGEWLSHSPPANTNTSHSTKNETDTLRSKYQARAEYINTVYKQPDNKQNYTAQ